MIKIINPKTGSAPILGGFLVLSALNSVGCNNKTQPVNPIHVENPSVTTSLAPNQDEWIDFSITLSTQNFTVTAVSLPILNPQNPSIQYGSLSIQPVLCTNPSTCPYGNSAQIGVNLDVTSFIAAKGVAPILPNGAPLPVGGLQNSTVVALPVSNTGAEVYFALGKGVAMLGAAIPFTQMSVVGQVVPGADLFIPITIKTSKGNFTLLPGIFTGQAVNTTGVGFFADLSGLLPQSGNRGMAGEVANVENHLVLSPTIPSSKKRTRLYQELWNLNEKGGRLDLQ